jgi:hypothetical protein
MALHWTNIAAPNSRQYVCGYCGTSLASEKGWNATHSSDGRPAFIFICHQCTKPTFFDADNSQTPGVVYGNPVKDITDDSVEKLYGEARRTTSAGAYTAAVLCCRKLLMHIAVAKGAKAGENFVSYVQFLTDNHFVPPDAKDWVDHIRKKGNEANHEIAIMNKDDAEELISFLEMLLKVIFEFPTAVKRRLGQP